MISFSRLPSLVGLVVLGFSLIYLFKNGPVIQGHLDSSELWRNAAHSSHQSPPHRDQTSATTSQHAPTPSKTSSTAIHTDELTTASYLSAAPLPSNLADHQQPNTVLPACANVKPNLILSAIDGPKWQDQIFIFMQSLEISLGEESLANERADLCPAAPVSVNIIVPATLYQELPPGFRALMGRYPSLKFVPALPEIANVPVVLRRFQGWSDHMNAVSGQYDKVLACDLDVVFQRNPFAMAMDSDVELLYFAEWRGMKIGQCSVHVGWYDHCASPESGNIITHQQSSAYMHRDRICAGSVYGTARAIRVYMDTMAAQLQRSNFECNDQAMHIHIYYSSMLDSNLRSQGIGQVGLVPNEDALFGTVGTTPMVTFNEWGEMLNERGQVQYAVHQYKTHSLLSDIVWRKYGWLAEVGQKDPIPAVPQFVQDSEAHTIQTESGSQHDSQRTDEEMDPRDLKDISHGHSVYFRGGEEDFKELKWANHPPEMCGTYSSLCSCKYDDCLVHYEYY